MMKKITIMGGGGVRTPLLVYGLAQAQSTLGVEELCLYDIDAERAGTIARLGREIVRQLGAGLEIRVETSLEEAAAGAGCVLNSVRAGGMAARARDERVAIGLGFAGQETTGAGGAAMALRTLPVTLAHARIIEKVAPDTWLINFTNPAGLMTQALMQNTRLRVIGICDTPSELFHKLAEALNQPLSVCEFDYVGLNHLGWVRRVKVRGEDVTARVLNDAELLRRLYPEDLFDPTMIQALGLIPTEYLFFYYSQHRAYENQMRAGASRGEELDRLNAGLFQQLRGEEPAQALATYRAYLLRRNASYMKLEAQGGSAFGHVADDYNPFETPTGYHRIALEVLTGLVSKTPRHVVLNVVNGTTIEDLEATDVVEVPCDVDQLGLRPHATGKLPAAVRGLVLAVKEYERTLISAALSGSASQARLALVQNPIVGQWEPAGALIDALIASDAEHLGYLRR